MSERLRIHPIHPLPETLLVSVIDEEGIAVDVAPRGGGESTIGLDLAEGNGGDTNQRKKEKILLRKGLSEIPDADLRDKTEQYLNEIEKIPLLTKEEERAYGRDMDVGVFLRREKEGKSLRKTVVDLVQKLHNGRKLLFHHFPPEAYTVDGIHAAITASHGPYPSSLFDEIRRVNPSLENEENGERILRDLAEKKGNEEIEPVSLAALALPPRIVKAYIESLVQHNSHIVIEALQDISYRELEEHFSLVEEKEAAAKDKLVTANLRLGMSVATKYIGNGILLPDLIQYASMGLRRGTEKYDYRKGYKVGTYVYWWIRQSVTAAITAHSSTIQISEQMREFIGFYLQAYDTMIQRLARNPNREELAAEMKMPVEKIQEIEEAMKKRTTLSLTNPVKEGSNETLESTLADTYEESPESAAETVLLRAAIDTALGELTKREKIVLLLRFGLEDGRQRERKEIAEELGISRERARQIEEEALTKLRRSHIRKSLQEAR